MRFAIVASAITVAIACDRPDAAPLDAGVDAAIPALEQVVDSLPLGLSERPTYPDGVPLASRPWRLIDDCRVCMLGTLGLKCSRRAGCARELCVLTDGTELPVGASVDTAWCHTCTCGAGSALRCGPRVDAACPAGRCRVTLAGQAIDLAVGEQVFTSECSVAQCTPDGVEQRDVCHDVCTTHTGSDVPLDHAALDIDGCAICTCNYGSWCCERRPECPLTEGDPSCPSPGECTTPSGETVRGGTQWDFGNNKICTCAGGSWAACTCGLNPC